MKVRLLLIVLPAAIALRVHLPSSSRGVYFPGLTRFAPACGNCHNPLPGAPAPFQPILVSLQPTARILATGQSIQVALSATGGQSASPNGGFAMDTNAGTFSAGPNTAVVPPGNAITHSNSSTRSWSFGYTASNTPGLVELYSVVNTVNNDMINGVEDLWAFHGFDDTAVQGTPVRLFVNAPGVVTLGSACAGSFGNVPVLGCPQSPTAGNQTFTLDLHGGAPHSTAAVLLGVTAFNPGLDLGIVGVTGCALFVDPLVTIFGGTSAGDAQRGEGAASFGVPIPNRPDLIGATLHCQGLVVDPANGRPTPLTMTNGVSATIL